VTKEIHRENPNVNNYLSFGHRRKNDGAWHRKNDGASNGTEEKMTVPFDLASERQKHVETREQVTLVILFNVVQVGIYKMLLNPRNRIDIASTAHRPRRSLAIRRLLFHSHSH
jgi:hypothetical protein